MIELTADELGALLTYAARHGLEIGRAGTEGDFTAEGIAAIAYAGFMQERARG